MRAALEALAAPPLCDRAVLAAAHSLSDDFASNYRLLLHLASYCPDARTLRDRVLRAVGGSELVMQWSAVGSR